MRQHFEAINSPSRDKKFYSNPGRFRLQNQRCVIYDENGPLSDDEVKFYDYQNNDNSYVQK